MMNAQIDNQFVYIEDTSGGVGIYNSGKTVAGVQDYFDVTDDGGGVLESSYNLGLSGYTSDGGLTIDSRDGIYADPVNIFGFSDTGNWEGPVQWSGHTTNSLLCTVHPYFENVQDFVYSEKNGEKIIEPQETFIVPIKIFFQLIGDMVGDVDTLSFNSTISTSISRIKKIRFFVEPANLSRAIEFEIIFRIYRNRTYNRRLVGSVEIENEM
jgi:hypothetical protein